MRWTRAAAFSLLLLAVGCAPIPSVSPASYAPAGRALCSADAVSIHSDFAGAGAGSCTISNAEAITVEIVPETMPINPSPWYAFRIKAPAGTEPTVHLRYTGAKHRYAPWLQGPSGAWQALPPERVQTNSDGSATLSLPRLSGNTVVAAQPLDNPDAALRPWRALVARGKLTASEAGPTRDGRSLPIFLHRPKNAKGLLVLTARQHPPEVPGALAFDAFAARLFSQDTSAVAMRRQTAILLVPVLNPDGIARGHWRGNASAADLNRDWGSFVQPESRAVGEEILKLAADLPLLAVIDFHATRRDVIYAPPLEPRRHDVGEAFLAEFARAPMGRDVTVSRSHEAGSGTLKGWALDQFGITGLTYEVADAADRVTISKRAIAAADSLVAALLTPGRFAPAAASKGEAGK